MQKRGKDLNLLTYLLGKPLVALSLSLSLSLSCFVKFSPAHLNYQTLPLSPPPTGNQLSLSLSLSLS